MENDVTVQDEERAMILEKEKDSVRGVFFFFFLNLNLYVCCTIVTMIIHRTYTRVSFIG